VTIRPMRVRFVASAMAASMAQPSKTGAIGSAPGVAIRWSNSQQWSNPASSAMFHIARWTLSGKYPTSFSPTRSGCIAANIRADQHRAARDLVPIRKQREHYDTLAPPRGVRAENIVERP